MRAGKYIFRGEDRPYLNAMQHLAACSRDDAKEYAVEIKEHRKLRSNAQNRRLFAIYGEIVEFMNTYHDAGVSVEDVHFNMKSAILGMRETPVGMVPESTAKKDTSAFADYVDQVEAHAANEWGVVFSNEYQEVYG